MRFPAGARAPESTGPGPTLITGGGGFLGSHIARRLLARGDEVRVLGRRPYPELAALGADCRQADIRDARAVRKAMDGCRAVIHTAGRPGVSCLEEPFNSINYLGTQNVLDAAMAAGIRKFVLTSTPSVVYAGLDIRGGDESLPYPAKQLSPYAASKARAEKLALSLNSGEFATLALRPHLLFGPGDTQILPQILARARSGRLMRVGGGKNLVSVCYVENAAQAHLLALDRLEPGSPVAGQAYFINEPEPVNCWDFINRLLTGSGLPEVRKSVPAPAARLAGWGLETIYHTLGRSEDPPMTRFLAGQLAQDHWFRIDKARRELGWEPEVGMEEALRRTLG
jgi:nucleoside-diphosphate-sugar epimerase